MELQLYRPEPKWTKRVKYEFVSGFERVFYLMKIPWSLYLAWKQLFPTEKKVSFFSLLAVIGVALGVNVMIVVIAFMQGFQDKFRNDIIDSQGHARMVQVNPSSDWKLVKRELKQKEQIIGFSPYQQGQFLLQNGEYDSNPYVFGMNPENANQVLPLDQFLENGQLNIETSEFTNVTPVPSTSDLEDGVVFVSLEVARELGVRPAAIFLKQEHNEKTSTYSGNGEVVVKRLDPFVSSADWELEIICNEKVRVTEFPSGYEQIVSHDEGLIDLGYGKPVFEIIQGERPFLGGETFGFECFKSSVAEVYSLDLFKKAKSDELSPPREVRIGGIIEVPWQGFHSKVMVGTLRFMQEMKGEEGKCDGFFLRFSETIAQNDEALSQVCNQMEKEWSKNWAIIPWFVENAWFFELLKFEEYLMILIMIPIGLVAAFAIAIALMTSVLRKVREIGLLVAMGGSQQSVGAIFCFQGMIIGGLGAFLGCGLALLFIYFRDELMNFIVTNIAGEDGQVGVTQFYDFYSLRVFYPWESNDSLSMFISFAAFSVLVSTIAGLLPAWRASKMNPADALRSE